MDRADAALDQSEHDRMCRAAGADHQRFVGHLVPSGRGLVEIVEEALHVGIGRAQLSTVEP
jgi:hypothetical protein